MTLLCEIFTKVLLLCREISLHKQSNSNLNNVLTFIYLFILCLNSNLKHFSCYFKEIPAIELNEKHDDMAAKKYYTRSFKPEDM